MLNSLITCVEDRKKQLVTVMTTAGMVVNKSDIASMKLMIEQLQKENEKAITDIKTDVKEIDQRMTEMEETITTSRLYHPPTFTTLSRATTTAHGSPH